MDKRVGLTETEVLHARRAHGENRFSKQKREGFLRQFLRGFTDPMILILLAALCLNVLFVSGDGEWFETIGIALAILISVFVSTLSEFSSEKAFEKLQEAAGRLRCRVRRGGAVLEIFATELVVGDVVLLSAGDVIPADGRMIFGQIGVDQSALNGESREAEKFPCERAQELSDPGALFSPATVSHGEAEMVVTAVGDATLYGKLAGELQETGRKSPLKEKLAVLAKNLAKVGYCAAALIALADLLYAVFEAGSGDLIAGMQICLASPSLFYPALLHAFTLAVTVVVVAVPEGLPMMITVVLSSQMRRMLKEGVLLRKLSGIETAGNMDLLFCDKTGTLTEGVHSVRRIYGFSPEGLCPMQPDREMLSRHFVSNNQAKLQKGKARGSNATDRALLEYAHRQDARVDQCRVQARIAFESALKYSAAELSDGTLVYKGAPEKLLKTATHALIDGREVRLNAALKRQLDEAIRKEESAGVRMVAFAQARGALSDRLPREMTLVALAALSDALRKETRSTVASLQGAGVQIVMLTGDSESTAIAIAKSAGILKKDGCALSSESLRAMNDEALVKLLPTLSVVYRCTPADKSRLARLASREGRVTAMTGDGVNDAPALKLADVGFAMGSGTQIAKDAADVILTDDRLSSLERAVLYGRTIFRSIQKFLTFQLTMNFCAVFVSFLGPMLGIESPITVLQMLWVNLIMDTLASLAFSGEAPRESYMKKPPLKRTAPILSKAVFSQIVFATLFSLTLSSFFLASSTLKSLYGYSTDQTPFLTAFFFLFVFLGAFNLFNVRTPRQKLWAELSKNPGFVLIFLIIATVQIAMTYFGGTLFRTTPLPLPLLLFPILLALLIVPADLLRKGLLKKNS